MMHPYICEACGWRSRSKFDWRRKDNLRIHYWRYHPEVVLAALREAGLPI